jgi:paraquat-inducible protein A
MDLIACYQCDLLQREPRAVRPGPVHCSRCNGILYSNVPHSLDRTLALMAGAALLFLLANIFPLMSIEIQGRTISTTLIGISRVLADQGQLTLAVIFLLTVVVMPALEIIAVLSVLLPVKLGVVPAHLPRLMRTLCFVRPWGMVDVFIVGALVSIARITQLGDVIPGVAIWSLGGVMILLAAADSTFEGRPLWAAVREIRQWS